MYDLTLIVIGNTDIKLDDIESYLRECMDKTTTNYRKLLCLYDQKKYKQ